MVKVRRVLWLYRIVFVALFLAVLAAASTMGLIASKGPGLLFYIVAGIVVLLLTFDLEQTLRKRRNEKRADSRDAVGAAPLPSEKPDADWVTQPRARTQASDSPDSGPGQLRAE
jgi:hypothetical protein